MKSFGHRKPVRDGDGNITGSKDAPVKARTLEPLGPAFGADRKKRLVVTLEANDQIVIRLERTARKFQADARDVLRWLMRCDSNLRHLEKARAAKDRKATRLAAQREARWMRKVKNGN